MEIEDEKVKEIENDIRDIINWVEVFEEEYNLPKEVVDQLKDRLEKVAVKLGL